MQHASLFVGRDLPDIFNYLIIVSSVQLIKMQMV